MHQMIRDIYSRYNVSLVGAEKYSSRMAYITSHNCESARGAESIIPKKSSGMHRASPSLAGRDGNESYDGDVLFPSNYFVRTTLVQKIAIGCYVERKVLSRTDFDYQQQTRLNSLLM